MVSHILRYIFSISKIFLEQIKIKCILLLYKAELYKTLQFTMALWYFYFTKTKEFTAVAVDA